MQYTISKTGKFKQYVLLIQFSKQLNTFTGVF